MVLLSLPNMLFQVETRTLWNIPIAAHFITIFLLIKIIHRNILKGGVIHKLRMIINAIVTLYVLQVK